jgi:pimeloyl-ACP methyl ester carboxylesterase
MPLAVVDTGSDTIRLHYRLDGDPSRPCVVLSNSLGTDLHMWDAHAARLDVAQGNCYGSVSINHLSCRRSFDRPPINRWN